MVKLDPKDSYCTLINTFTVEPAKAEELLKILSEATAHGMSQRLGFVSANLHMSEDRKHVTNYAQWRSKADVDAMMADPSAREHMGKAAELATKFEPIYYELRDSHEA